MKLTYIFHSGFSIETSSCIIIFDFWMDPAGVMPGILQRGKPLYVLASHFHEDHFSRQIFLWRRYGECHILLSKDILRHHRAEKEEADAWLVKGDTWSDSRITVHATGSNDSGVSWIVEVDGQCIFHAGDLNNWYARFLTDDYKGGTIMSREFGEIDPLKDEKQFLGELKDIAKITRRMDVAMFPIDGRIGNGYTRGGRQLTERFEIALFVPMHFVASGFESAWRMKEYADQRGIDFWKISSEGESITFCQPIDE